MKEFLLRDSGVYSISNMAAGKQEVSYVTLFLKDIFNVTLGLKGIFDGISIVNPSYEKLNVTP